VRLGRENIDALFFKHRWDQYGFDKKRFRTRYIELVFLHPVGSACHVEHSGASGARNDTALFFMLGWDWYGFDKKPFNTRYARHVFFCIRRDLQVT
jgi:hypothetical protein